MRVATRRIDVQAVVTGLVLGAVFGVATLMGLGLRGDARYAPLLATVPGLGFALFEIVRGLIGRPAEPVPPASGPEDLPEGPPDGQGVTDVSAQLPVTQSSHEPATASALAAAPDPAAVTRVPLTLVDRMRTSGELWLLLLLALFLLLGTVPGLLLFVVLYMRLRSRAPWLGVLVNLAIVYVSLQVLFFRILNLPTFGGFLRGML